MAGINKVIIIGYLGKDPDVRYTNDGRAVTNLSVGVSESWKNKNTGERREKTEWVNVVIFGKLAEVIGQYASKGRQVYIEGKLQTRSWEKDGITRYTTDVTVDMKGTVQLLGPNERPAEAGSSYHGGGYQGGQGDGYQHGGGGGYREPPRAQDPPDYNDDDIPF